MKKINTPIIAIALTVIIAISSCDVLLPILNQVVEEQKNIPLTESEVVLGLKDALKVGTNNSVNIVSKADGFYKNELIKILLPPEAKIITDNKDNAALKAIGITKLIDDVILRLNRSAEDASTKASPIFLSAIKSMSIQDAFSILKGSDNAATTYFKSKTLSQLKTAFKPEIKKSLDKPLVANISTNKAWSTLTTNYNKIANFSSSLKPVNTNLDDYVTSKAIEGLFKKLEEQEKLIRHDPVARVTDILKKVFG